MTLRFAPSRIAALSAILATGLGLFFSPAAFARPADDTQPPQKQTPYPGTPVEEVIARVNDQVINTSDYNRAEQDLEQQSQQHQWTQQQLYDQKHDLLRDLIDQQLLLSRGKQLGITGETELVKQLDAMRKQYHLDTIEDLQKAAEAQGVSWQDFKATMRNHLISQLVIQQEVAPKIYGNISPSQIQAYYDAHKDEFTQPEQVQLSEILIPTADPDNAAQVAEARQKADDAEAKLKSGEDFATLAKAVSGGMTASNGGDLGEFHRGQLAKVLEDATFDLKPGQFTEPIRTKQGWIILKVTEHTPGGLQPLSDVEQQVQSDIGMAKMQPALRDYLTKLREAAYIEIRAGYEDSGASPNEMKPVYTAYAPPQPKKKKAKRTRFNGRGRHANKPAAEKASLDTSGKDNTTMKPGKKEKIRFGQAPRETLPPAETTVEDAAANGSANAANGENQVAGNNSDATNAVADEAPAEQAEHKEKKTRFSDRARLPKEKKSDKPKIDPFAPPPETTLETATRGQQDKPLGLNGDNSKAKKKNPKDEGPKRRFGNEGKKKDSKPAPDPFKAPASAPGSNSTQQ
ncbi:MAG TPA: peptidyl-prolyl cis-trans isomerase [Acidobacteriaceae bacterium]|jgi:peptidyl-prolyl cis-trans isomerase SurA|nr:peptidyl-prolyl cis-trans isomerase [Acidobacteriaceae bacterium]